MKKRALAIVVFAVGTSVSASAADLRAPVLKAPPMAPAPYAPYSWTGWYVGGNAGYGWMRSTDTVTAANVAAAGFTTSGEVATSLPLDPKGFVGGGQIGYNWQIAPTWVAGLEADIQGTDLKSTVALPGPNDFTRIMTASEKLDWLGTARARLGVTAWDRGLVYATGGLAYGQASLSTALTRISGCNGANNCQAGTVSDTRVGWTLGGGVEWVVIQSLSVKAEYLYFDLGTISHSMTDPFFPAVFNASAPLKGSIARAGLNYRFGY